eukprot:m.248389 g.248389  ORF g.248389 m.248389 type:complete len:64 (-) comp10972_c0_seq32:479-670(-)
MKGCVSKVIFAVDAGPKGKEQPCGDFLAVACSTMKGGVSTLHSTENEEAAKAHNSLLLTSSVP